ncbi:MULTISPECIES: hypothetical protein [unclassified Paraburkholderia]|uniref:hypothetical protein n=1 Tax=unclassified Paraburkholderia TaxID=2615204 RepID=UPI00198261E2|nr:MULTISPECIES: hypothetical protein [unclassified Paraburkholderia]MBN3858614.1 hypothetical protein [Paraburkholderia sp. Ac-20340]
MTARRGECRESAQKTAKNAPKSHKFHCNSMICHFWSGSTADKNHFRYSRGFGPRPALFLRSLYRVSVLVAACFAAMFVAKFVALIAALNAGFKSQSIRR